MYNSDYNRPPEEREPIETEHFHVWDAESPKPPRKKSGAARFVALGLCCALVGGLVGGGGVLAASHLSGGKTTIYQGTSPNSIGRPSSHPSRSTPPTWARRWASTAMWIPMCSAIR